jgi:DNA mismatch repair protein MutS
MTKTILDEYFFYHDKNVKLYGNMTIVAMQIGGFYECYATPTKGCDMTKLCEATNLVKANKKETHHGEKLFMAGFNTAALDKFLKLLVDNGFTVVVISQTTTPPNPKRAITGIYSPGTYITGTDTVESNNIVSLFIEDEKQLLGEYLTCVGMSSIDLSTGECSVYEAFSSNGDDKYAMDEAYRFIIGHNPKEIIISRKEIPDVSMTKENLMSYLELENKHIHYNTQNNIDKTFYKINYQNEFFGKIYKDTGMSTPIEYMEMELMSYARMSLIILCVFAYKHNENFINYLDKPYIFKNNKHLILGNNAIYQLNILENNTLEYNNGRFKCLFDVVNQTSTAMGRRCLKNTILQPLNDIEEINLRYNCIEELIKDNLYITVEKHLEYILDIERLSRKLCLSLLHPYEFANLIESLKNIEAIYTLIQKTQYNNKYITSEKDIKELNDFLTVCVKNFNIDELKKQNLNDITGSFFNKDIYPQIDVLQDRVINNIQSMEEMCKVLSGYVDDKNKFKKADDLKIQLKRNDRDGYYMSLTKRRAGILKEKIKNMETIKINDGLTIDPGKLEFKDLDKGNTKIFFNDLNDKSNDAITQKEKLIALIKKKYLELLVSYGQKYKDMFRALSKFIAIIDFIKSNAKLAKLYNYCKPEIILNENNGYINATKIRHPIIERLITEVEYIPHDIKLGRFENNEMIGMLLFGLNSAGKSTLQKSVGLNLIMAQCGMYVAAEKYIYSPYESLFARITGNDNMFKNQSSFTLEMIELKAILKRASAKTLVIGDEVCRGTEHVSGNAIVAASIIKLSISGSSFLFATHLHEIAKMERIRSLNNTKIFHLSVEYDHDKDVLIFDRKLKEGPGSSIYGLTVAKYIIKDNDFMELASEIKNELVGTSNELLTTKTSPYNINVFVDKCQTCGEKNDELDKFVGKLDTHHILNQQHCKAGFSIEKSHVSTNSKANLCVLCKLCHHKAHHGQLEIYGYKDTSKGRILDYKFIDDDEMVEVHPKKNKKNKSNKKKTITALAV